VECFSWTGLLIRLGPTLSGCPWGSAECGSQSFLPSYVSCIWLKQTGQEDAHFVAPTVTTT